MFLLELLERLRWWKGIDRIGPDIPYTHWRLYFKSTRLKLCKQKFKYFDDTAEFRPGAYAIVCSKISIGKGVIIRPGTMLFADPRENGAGITIEDYVLIAPGVHIYLVTHKFDNPELTVMSQGYEDSKEVVLKKGCWIGANSIILTGVTIGENAVIGAGSVVTKDIPDRAVAAGSPAKIIRLR